MALPPKLSTSSPWSFFVSTEAAYAEEEAIKQLQEIETQLTLFAGQINIATEKTQTLLSKALIQKSLPNALTPTKCRDIKRQIEEVFATALLGSKGEVIQKLKEEFAALNKSCGTIRAEALALEETARDFDSLIEKTERLVIERKKTLESAKKTLEAAREASESMTATLTHE